MSLNNPSDLRLSQLNEWLATAPAVKVSPESIRPASADASFRRYFRVDGADGATYIAMDAPPPHEDVRPFIHVAEVFGQTGASVPKILAQDVERGFLLLSDLGTTTYLNQLNADTAHKLYLDAIDALVLIQAQSKPGVLPEYDRALLQRELMLFPDWYVGKHLGVTLSDKQTETLNKVFEVLLANNLAQPQVYVHRDYHSRNLMVIAPGNPGILDFQDAVYGPITYDLVSLLRDAYIQWDEEMVLDWAIRYWERAKRAGLPVNPDVDAFYRDFEFMGLQRHLKVLGIFARLYHRDGKDGYLKDLPLVMEYTRKAAGRYNALAPLIRLLDELEEKAPQVGYTF
ncbi:aminoglycoside phosphotransferase family protein [Noviherbaspirillum sp. UKPF54]|uniref:aminoglycoside phosphotransferase family protein n=1 Tax=Noviherbaspirillum sp. UKPF54 TaxID=2601898 RepID=UPI0011B1A1BD|nr:phosphotransferase [Noviherbaspirillum sp. UKPF54]QDZ26501.1 aminoglycoside phosphotransferase [Noviherbaspirillum sp. UKPF54]